MLPGTHYSSFSGLKIPLLLLGGLRVVVTDLNVIWIVAIVAIVATAAMTVIEVVAIEIIPVVTLLVVVLPPEIVLHVLETLLLPAETNEMEDGEEATVDPLLHVGPL